MFFCVGLIFISIWWVLQPQWCVWKDINDFLAILSKFTKQNLSIISLIIWYYHKMYLLYFLAGCPDIKYNAWSALGRGNFSRADFRCGFIEAGELLRDTEAWVPPIPPPIRAPHTISCWENEKRKWKKKIDMLQVNWYYTNVKSAEMIFTIVKVNIFLRWVKVISF